MVTLFLFGAKKGVIEIDYTPKCPLQEVYEGANKPWADHGGGYIRRECCTGNEIFLLLLIYSILVFSYAEVVGGHPLSKG
jgi:hypothetical protein